LQAGKAPTKLIEGHKSNNLVILENHWFYRFQKSHLQKKQMLMMKS